MKFYLEKMLNKRVNLVHFIGIGGASMSGLAQITLSKGIAVTGSDMKSSNYTENLKANGAKIAIGHNASNITDNCDLVVYTAAIHKDNPEMLKAKELNIPLMERSHYLGALTKDYDKTIAISGTHGKTTTSSLISTILCRAELDPTITIGGNLDLINGNYRVGQSEFFVTEACEYVDSFLKSHHNIGIILNIDLDHTDYFKNIKQLKQSFHQFAQIVPEDGLIIAYGDAKNVADVIEDLDSTVATYGLKNDNQWQALNITYDDFGKPEFDVYNRGSFFGHFKLNLPGEHNLLNALASIVCTNYLGVPIDVIKDSLASFEGVHRRFEFRGEVNGIKVVEDFAHHPTELKVTVQACTNYKYNKLWIVFQPHTYSRTYTFFNEFVDSFNGADFVIINDTYAAREENIYDIREEDLAKAIKDRLGIPTLYLSDFNDIIKTLVDNVGKDDFILVAGAGDINTIAPEIVQALEKKYEN